MNEATYRERLVELNNALRRAERELKGVMEAVTELCALYNDVKRMELEITYPYTYIESIGFLLTKIRKLIGRVESDLQAIQPYISPTGEEGGDD